MAKLGVGMLLVLAVSSWAGATMQHGCKDVQGSLFHLSYFPIRDMRRTVAITPQKTVMRLPDSLSVPVAGFERAPDANALLINRDVTAARFVNRILADSLSVMRGEQHFARLCSPCHGKGMAGDGPVARSFMPPPDLLGSTPRGRSDGYIYSYIRYGGPIMPRYGHALSPEATWDVINFIRQRQRTSPR
jgi:mono/diheme cytochrome c family protein